MGQSACNTSKLKKKKKTTLNKLILLPLKCINSALAQIISHSPVGSNLSRATLTTHLRTVCYMRIFIIQSVADRVVNASVYFPAYRAFQCCTLHKLWWTTECFGCFNLLLTLFNCMNFQNYISAAHSTSSGKPPERVTCVTLQLSPFNCMKPVTLRYLFNHQFYIIAFEIKLIEHCRPLTKMASTALVKEVKQLKLKSWV